MMPGSYRLTHSSAGGPAYGWSPYLTSACAGLQGKPSRIWRGATGCNGLLYGVFFFTGFL